MKIIWICEGMFLIIFSIGFYVFKYMRKLINCVYKIYFIYYVKVLFLNIYKVIFKIGIFVV